MRISEQSSWRESIGAESAIKSARVEARANYCRRKLAVNIHAYMHGERGWFDWANSRQFLAIADFIELALKSARAQCHANSAGQRIIDLFFETMKVYALPCIFSIGRGSIDQQTTRNFLPLRGLFVVRLCNLYSFKTWRDKTRRERERHSNNWEM